MSLFAALEFPERLSLLDGVPQAHRFIQASRGDHGAVRREGEGDDTLGVSIRDRPDRFATLVRIPDPDGLVEAGAGEELAVGRISHAQHAVGVALLIECAQILGRLRILWVLLRVAVPDLYGLVRAAGRHELAVRRKGDAGDDVAMTVLGPP